MILQGSNIMNITPSATAHPHTHQPAWPSHYPACEGFYMGQWHDIHPQYWTKFHVWEWLQQFVDTNQLDASCIPFQEFDITGERLCSMSLQEFTQAAGAAGHILYNDVQNLKHGMAWNGQYGSQMLQSLNVVIKTEQTDHSSVTPWKEDGCMYGTCYDDVYDIKPYCRNQLSVAPAHYTTAYAESEVKKSQDLPQRTGAKKHNPRGTHLWEFIRDILLTPDKNPGLIRWEDRSEGVFRFLKSEAVAQLWGKKKNNSSMTYEKLSRAMRYYYKREILERVDGRRLVYKFGKNARGWREDDS
ncbi:ETS homologous factor [Hyperolius riggenbachi]|uniref:ETS homologous factor n=1 Tax=Hyperolius riggenbachi TaxID=752182 RepID=UPI0035A38604